MAEMDKKPLIGWDKSVNINPLAIVVLAASAVVLCLSVMYYSKAGENATYDYLSALQSCDYIYPGVYIESYPIGGLTKEQALERVNNDADSLNRWSFNLYVMGEGEPVKTFTFAEAGASYDYEKAVADGYSQARSGSSSERAKEMLELLNKHYYIDPEYGFDGTVLKAQLNECAPKVNEILAQFGKEFDIDTTAQLITDNVLAKVKEFNVTAAMK
jgi:hypothetical protein